MRWLKHSQGDTRFYHGGGRGRHWAGVWGHREIEERCTGRSGGRPRKRSHVSTAVRTGRKQCLWGRTGVLTSSIKGSLGGVMSFQLGNKTRGGDEHVGMRVRAERGRVWRGTQWGRCYDRHSALYTPQRIHSRLTCSVILSKFNHPLCHFPEEQTALYLLLSWILPLMQVYEHTLPTAINGLVNAW